MNTVSVTVGIIGAMCSIIFAYIGYQRGKLKDTSSAGKTEGVIMSDIGYIKAGVDDLKREQRDANTVLSNHSERITRVEENINAVKTRVDKLEVE
jgi:hypothetical protein